MIEALAHVEREAIREAPEAPRARTRTCVGCGERVDVLDEGDRGELVRLVLGHGGEIAVDAGHGGSGRGAHVHVRPECLDRAARAGLLRATKGKAHAVLDDRGAPPAALSAGSLARAIQRAMDRRIEGLLTAAVRSRQAACGAEAVAGACLRDEAKLVVVACDAAELADLAHVAKAVAEGRAVAWGTRQRLGAVAPGAVRGRLRAPQGVRPDAEGVLDGEDSGAPATGVGVVAIASRSIAEALRRAVQAADRVSVVDGSRPRGPSGRRGRKSNRYEGGAETPPTPPGVRPAGVMVAEVKLAEVEPAGGNLPGALGGADERSEGGEGSPDRRLSGEESNVERGA